MPVRHILVVDDSKSARLMLRKMLQPFVSTVDTVDSAEEALDYLRVQRPDAIFMDHTMPGLDGLAAVQQIKREPTTALIPVIMYTSKDEPAYADQALAAGAIGVLVKPATSDALASSLAQMNTIFDTVAMEIASVPLPAAELEALASRELSPEQIEQIEQIAAKAALEKAESVVYDAIESQVLPLMNDVIAKVQRNLLADQEALCSQIATQIFEARFAQSPPSPDTEAIHTAFESATQTQLLPLLDGRLEMFRREAGAEIGKRTKELVLQACQTQLSESTAQWTQQLNASVAGLTQKAEEAARAAVTQTVQQAVSQAIVEANSTGQALNEETFQRLWSAAQQEVWRRIYTAAGGAAVIGVVAALLVYLLR